MEKELVAFKFDPTIALITGALGVLIAVIAYKSFSRRRNEVKKVHAPLIEKVKKIEIEEVKQKLFVSSGVYETKGRRPTMEDKHFDVDDIAEHYPDNFANFPRPTSFYAVYDGHRGSKASEFLEENLHESIIRNEKFGKGDIEGAIREGFIETDAKMLEIARDPKTKFLDGSTAAVALIIGDKLYAANCGDAEVILARKNDEGRVEPVLLSKLHKPTDPEEKSRIMKEGGLVLGSRVSGTLAVARAFGDVDFKTPYEDEDIKLGVLLTAEPYITSTYLIPHRDLFIIIGCDGVWEKLSRPDSVSFVAERIGNDDVSASCEELVNHAFNSGSEDNISAIVVKLNWA